MDTVMFGEVFAFTAVDVFTREADILVAPALTASYGEAFLEQAMMRRFDGHVELVQTDGGSEFKEAFAARVLDYCERHRVARPYKKNEQAFIESFNRTVRKECLGWGRYAASDRERCQAEAEAFLERYHYHRPHLGLGLHPSRKEPEQALSDIYGEHSAHLTPLGAEPILRATFTWV
jgi:transposase InsO family protein